MNLPSIKVSVWPMDRPGKVKAIAKVIFGDAISVFPIRVTEGKKGLFLGMPQVLDRQGEYRDVFFPVNADVRDTLSDMVLTTYKPEKPMYHEFVSEESFRPEITVRLYEDTVHDLMGYASIVINEAFRIENIKLFHGDNGRHLVLFPERGYRDNGEVVIKEVFDFKGDWENILKKQICEIFDRVYDGMKKEHEQVALGQKEGNLSYEELMQVRLRREAERRKCITTDKPEMNEQIVGVEEAESEKMMLQ